MIKPFKISNNKKTIKQQLCTIYGIGNVLCLRICDDLGYSSNTQISHLKSYQQDAIYFYIQQKILTGTILSSVMRKEKARYTEISCYRGIRHNMGLPCRGQRTHGNAQTVKALRQKNSKNLGL